MASIYSSGFYTNIGTAPTGDGNINALIGGTKWGGGLGTGATVTYSFPTDFSTTGGGWFATGSFNYSGEPGTGQALNFAQVTAVRSALQKWDNVANVNFVEVADIPDSDFLFGDNSSVGDLRFAESDSPPTAWAYLPGQDNRPYGGDVWFNKSDYNSPTVGSYAYYTVMHEIGHAIGLEHPHENGDGDTMGASTDGLKYTIMSYRDYPGDAIDGVDASPFPSTPMLLDVLAIQRIYGANWSYHAGNDTYSWAPGAQIFECIWDGGGYDTLSAANQTQSVKLHLTSGVFNEIGSSVWLDDFWARDNLVIAYNAVIERAVGSAYNDEIYGNQYNNVLEGGAGDDLLRGSEWADHWLIDHDTMYGGAGNDFMGGHDGNDWMSGDAGHDSVIGDGGNDTLYGGEGNDWVVGDYTDQSGNGADWMAGGNGDDTMEGGTGDDTMYGEAGNDRMYGQAGTDLLDGGAGADTQYGGDGNDTIWGAASTVVTDGADAMYGENGNDLMGGSYGADTMDGGAGDDAMYGDEGNDLMYGRDGGDLMRGDWGWGSDLSGADTMYGGSGNDRMYGGAGNDFVYGEGGGNYVDGGDGDDYLGGGELTDSMFGGNGNDMLVGGWNLAAGDRMDGGAGNDEYHVDTGDVVIEALAAGTDRMVVYSNNMVLAANVEEMHLMSIASVLAAWGNSLNNVITGNEFANVIYAGAGSDSVSGLAGNDTLKGEAGNDTLLGGLGNDMLEGGLDNDVLRGEAGNDVLDGGPGNDTLDGGLDIDTATYSTAGAAVTVNLSIAGAQATGGSGSDTLVAVENLIGSAFNDTLIGNALANTLTGGSGNDTLKGEAGDDTAFGGLGNDVLEGGAGNDTLRGEAGDDTLNGGLGNDVIDGGLGNDTVSYAGTTGSVGVNLATGVATGAAGTDTLIGVENVTGGNVGDTLTGSASANVIRGEGGNDILRGAAGNDLLSGGLGADLFAWTATAFNTADVTAGGIDVVSDLAAGDKIDFTSSLEVLLRVNGTALSATAANVVLGNAFSLNTNVALNADTLWLDLDNSHSFTAADFQVDLGLAASLTYNAAADVFML